MSSSNTSSDAVDQPRTEHEKSCLEVNEQAEEEMLVFGSLLSDKGNFPQEPKTNEKCSRHDSNTLDSFSEMWLIVRKSKTDVLDVFFHTRLVESCVFT